MKLVCPGCTLQWRERDCSFKINCCKIKWVQFSLCSLKSEYFAKKWMKGRTSLPERRETKSSSVLDLTVHFNLFLFHSMPAVKTVTHLLNQQRPTSINCVVPTVNFECIFLFLLFIFKYSSSRSLDASQISSVHSTRAELTEWQFL